MSKRILTLVLALMICLSPVSGIVHAANVTNIADIQSVGDTLALGSFMGKPIVWQVLEVDNIASKALLIPTELIGFWAFNAKNEVALWESSTIRIWLNSEFLDVTFTEVQKAAILETTLDNKAFAATGLAGGAGTATVDKVFLLSYDEADRYFASDGLRQAKYNATEAEYTALGQALEKKGVEEDWFNKLTSTEANNELSSYVGYTDWWWLRTTGTYADIGSARVACVNYDGSMERNNEIFEPLGGLRPAMWVSIAKAVDPKPPTTGIVSDWAKPDIDRAEDMGLIPDSLKGQDLTKSITRAEFAAVTVKVFETLSSSSALPAVTNPFTDTKDVEVLKAFNTGLMVGTSATEFTPDVLLTREQAATALTRVFKRSTMPGWSIATDGNYPLDYTMPALFADDAQISDWARGSVYFMAANGIIGGVGNNMFAPRAVTSEEQAMNYATATREQALLIALRMVENLG